MPMLSGNGLRMGARITIFDVASMSQPAAFRITIISRISSNGSFVTPATDIANPCGIPKMANASARGPKKAMIG